MKRKLISVILTLLLVLSSAGNFIVFAESDSDNPDMLRSIFGGIDEVNPDDKSKNLPYLNGTVLSDVREPFYISGSGSKVFGESSFASDTASWKNSGNFKLPSGKVTVNGTEYNIGSEYKLLGAAEGDFDGDGKKEELAFLTAAVTNDGKSLLMICGASAAERDGTLFPIAVLYSGTKDFYGNIKDFANCLEILCADVNGDGYDEIVTATPTSGYGTKSSDKYGFDRYGGAYLWSLESDGRNAKSWRSSDGWCHQPSEVRSSMNVTYGDNCYLGAPGTTAAIASGDVDGDGYDDLVTAFSTTKAQYNPNYSSNMFAVYYVGGAPTADEMIFKRSHLMRFIDGNIKKELNLGVTSGDAAGFDVDICDIDGSGKPTIFLSFKQTVHHWQAMSGTKMFTPAFYIYSFDMKTDFNNFKASLLYRGGIYHHGWMAGGGANDTDYVYRTDPIDCAPVRIGILKGDFGASDGKKGFVSSGTVIADQRYFSFVRYPEGNIYRYDTVNEGSYTGTWGMNREDNGHGFSDNDCVFYRNGINVTDIRSANVRFDGTSYEDAALVSAYTDNGFRTYFVQRSGKGYMADVMAQNDSAYAVAAMPDTDNDSIYLKYNKHKFFWADPVIIAALASPPYFESLPSDMYSNSQTTYGKSMTTSAGKSESYTVSAGSYISTEIKAGGIGTSGVFESEAESMNSSSSGREETEEVSYTQSFSASGGSDTVVLSTVAYDAYSYTAYYPGTNGELAESPYIVYVPRGGSDSIKIAAINYDDYLEFVKYADGALPDLKDVFTHMVGKPETYPQEAPSGSGVLNGSVLMHTKLAGFPSDESSQTLSIDITKETSETTASGSSVSVKLGGGYEAEADDIFGLVNTGSKITVGSSSEKEYESGKIRTNAVGTSFEGTVFGQGDGMNVSGGTEEKAYFNWRLLHYIHDFNDGDSVQQFPVVTYITSGVVQPSGVVPDSLSVTPSEMSVEQVGPKTEGYVNEVGFTAKITGVTREAYTALEGAPLGMTLNTGGGNIGTSGSYPFGIKINSNVKPGRYELCLNVGGVRSNTFTVVVDKYTDPIWIETDKSELDFGRMRYRYSGGTPSADAQTVTVKNIYTEQIKNLYAELDENSDFEITEALSSNLLYAKDLENSTATVKIAPKRGLDVGIHTGTLKISNGVTSAFVSLKYTVTEPTVPEAPSFRFAASLTPNPIKLLVEAPDDDGGGQMLYYLYTIKGHENYIKDGMQVWERSYNTAQSGHSFELYVPDELTVGSKYTIGLKAKTTCGESEAAWHEFEVSAPPNDPDPVKNLKVYPGNGSITVTWDAPDYWGENEYWPEIAWKYYKIEIEGNGIHEMYGVDFGDEREWIRNGLENGKEYEITVYSFTQNRETSTSVSAVPSEALIAPSRPTSVKADMSYKSAVISWKEPCYRGDSISGYQISKDSGKSWVDVANTPDENAAFSYGFDGLTTNREYEFRVRAVNTCGAGDSAVITQIAPPNLGAPTINDVIRGYEQLELEWLPITHVPVTGYEVKLDDGAWQKVDPIVFDGTLHYIFTGLENDREYALHVRATNEEGGGNESMRKRKPSSEAPLPPIDPRAEPRNGGIYFFGEKHNDGDVLQFKVDGDSYWRTLYGGAYRTNGYENGKEYTVAIATEGTDIYNMTVRSTVYLTVTPDENIPDPPSSPDIDSVIGDDYVRVSWTVENDGGTPIDRYEVTVGEDDPMIFPKDETAFWLKRSRVEENGYLKFKVEVFNSAGSSSNSVYLYADGTLEGLSDISLPQNRSAAFNTPYRLTMPGYSGEDGDGNAIEERDITDYAYWSITADSEKITWDDNNKYLVVDKDLGGGIYNAVISARYQNYTYEKNVKIVIGNTAKIISAQTEYGGVSVNLDLPSELGEVILCAASYDGSGKLVDTAMKTVSAQSFSDGEVSLALEKGTRIKVMLFGKKINLKPLCKSEFAN